MTPYTATTSIQINVSPAKVWQGLTDPELVKQWLFGTLLEAEWKVGGKITYSGEWQGKAYQDKGTVLEIEPEKKLVTTYWSVAFGEDIPENYQTVTYEITPNETGCLLTLTQANAPSDDSRKHSEENWTMVLGGMKKLLESA